MNRILIVEDEEPAAKRLIELLHKIDVSAEIVGKTDSIDSTVKWLSQNDHPDLIMLDIQLGDGLSFDIFKRISTSAFVIFTTAYDEYAIKAFELNSIDYLLKPVRQEHLARAYEKFNRMKGSMANLNIGELIRQLESKKNSYKARFIINIQNKLIAVDTKQIACFYTLEKNTFLCTFEGRCYPIDFSLDTIENQIDPDLYFRINRQQLIHYDAIKSIHLLSKSRIKLDLTIKTDSDCYVSFARSPEFRKWLDR